MQKNAKLYRASFNFVTLSIHIPGIKQNCFSIAKTDEWLTFSCHKGTELKEKFYILRNTQAICFIVKR